MESCPCKKNEECPYSMVILCYPKDPPFDNWVEWCPISRKVQFAGGLIDIPTYKSDEHPSFEELDKYISGWTNKIITGYTDILPNARWNKALKIVKFFGKNKYLPDMPSEGLPGKRAVKAWMLQHK